jgi:hypothetical protein
VQRARGHHDPIADLRLHHVLLNVSGLDRRRPELVEGLSACGSVWLLPA